MAEHETRSFAWRGRCNGGQSYGGTLEAPDRATAAQRLAQLGVRGVEIREMLDRPADTAIPDGVLSDDPLARLGLPLDQALGVVAETAGSRRLASAMRGIAEAVARGTPPAEAVARHTAGFPAACRVVLDAAARNGRLPQAFAALAAHARLVRGLRVTLAKTVAIPVAAFLFILAVWGALATLVLTSFSGLHVAQRRLYQAQGTDLPYLTRSVFAASELWPQTAGWTLGAVAACLLGCAVLRFMAGRWTAADWMLGKLPLVGRVFRHGATARWCSFAVAGIAAGLPLPDVPRLAGAAVGSARLKRGGAEMPLLDRSGRSARSRQRAKLPPPIIAAFEHTRTRDEAAECLSTFAFLYRGQAVGAVTANAAVAVPLLMLFGGVLVLMIVMAVFLRSTRLTTLLA